MDSTDFTQKPAIDGVPSQPKRLLYLRDYDIVDSIPEYKRLSFAAKYKLSLNSFLVAFNATYLGRLYLNLNYQFSVLLMKYFPYLAFFRFGVKASFVNIFTEDPVDNTEPKPNSEYYKPSPPTSWYSDVLSVFFW